MPNISSPPPPPRLSYQDYLQTDHWRSSITYGGLRMTITKQDIDAALARLTEAFPQTFVLERNRPHRPLKVGIAADIPARCPAVERRVLSVALRVYARRVMYLRGLVAGAARVDLDGNACGEVTARDAKYAAAKLAKSPGVARSQAGRGCGSQGRGPPCQAGGRGASSRKDVEKNARATVR